MQPAPKPVDRPRGPIRLGHWTLDPDRNLLTSSDAERRLEPKAVDALLVLVEQDGGVVPKQELIDRVWESRIISEGTLTNTIAELRRALDDDARNPSYIETIPKRGYRLVCRVERGLDGASQAPESRVLRRWTIAAATLIAVAVAATAVVLQLRKPALEPDHVYAAMFVNRTGDPGLDPYSSLARDRILSQLTGSGIAQPIPDSSDQPPATIDQVCRQARPLGAGLAVAGALYLHDGGVEVQAQLVDVAEGQLLYAVQPVIGARGEVTASVDEAVQRVLGAVATHLYAHAHSTLLARPPIFEAYREFIAGSEIYVDDLPAAIRHLERAIEIDPEFTSARFRLSMAYKTARRAPEGRALLDHLYQRRGVLTEFERAWLDAFLANFEGRWEDALKHLNRALEMAPNDWSVLYLIGSHELYINQPGHVVDTFAKLHGKTLPDFVARHPLYGESYTILSTAHHQLGNHHDELATARAGRKLFPSDLGLMRAEARALAAMGDLDGLQGVIEDARTAPGQVQLARLLVAAAASASTHGHPSLATDLCERAADALTSEQGAEMSGHGAFVLGRGLTALGRLNNAQQAFTQAVSDFDNHPGRAAVMARGWLGVVAARRGDVDTAEAMDRELAAIDDPYQYGYPEYYRAAIAGWCGRRDQALDLLREARSRGWGAYYRLHDDDRGLFEPLEGEEYYRAMLLPAD